MTKTQSLVRDLIHAAWADGYGEMPDVADEMGFGEPLKNAERALLNHIEELEHCEHGIPRNSPSACPSCHANEPNGVGTREQGTADSIAQSLRMALSSGLPNVTVSGHVARQIVDLLANYPPSTNRSSAPKTEPDLRLCIHEGYSGPAQYCPEHGSSSNR